MISYADLYARLDQTSKAVQNGVSAEKATEALINDLRTLSQSASAEEQSALAFIAMAALTNILEGDVARQVYYGKLAATRS